MSWWLTLLLTYAPMAHSLLPLSFVVAERLLYMPCVAACLLLAALLSRTRHPPSNHPHSSGTHSSGHRDCHAVGRVGGQPCGVDGQPCGVGGQPCGVDGLCGRGQGRRRQVGSRVGKGCGRRVSQVVVGVVLVGAGARTMRRCVDWRDDTSLFTAAASAYPRSAKVWLPTCWPLTAGLPTIDRLPLTSDLRLYPRSAKAIYQLGDGLVQRGRATEAMGHFHAALAIEPLYHYAYLHLARLALQRADPAAAYDYASASLRAVPAPNPHAHHLASLALLDEHQHRHGAEERHGDTAQAHGRSHAHAAKKGRFDGGTLLHGAKELERAATHSLSAIAADASGPDVGAYWRSLGEARSLQQQWSEAAHSFRTAALLMPTDAGLGVNEGAALLHLRQPSQALARFERAIALAERGEAGAGVIMGEVKGTAKRQAGRVAAPASASGGRPTAGLETSRESAVVEKARRGVEAAHALAEEMSRARKGRSGVSGVRSNR